MHTSEYGDGVEQTRFLHNGDYSGDVIVVRNSTAAQGTLHHQTHTYSFEIPFKHLEQLVLDKFRSDLIRQLEDCDYDTLRRMMLR